MTGRDSNKEHLTLHGAVDSPVGGDHYDGGMRISGWCFADTSPARAVRVLIDGKAHKLARGIPRPDVIAAHPDAPNAFECGFDGSVTLAAGPHDLAIEASFENDQWHRLANRSVEVHLPQLRMNMDTPSPMRTRTGRIRFSGWCVHPTQTINDLQLAIGNVRVTCQYGLERPDVAAALSDLPGAARSGFEAAANIPPGNWPVRLTAILDDASESTHEWPADLVVQALPWRNRLTKLLRFTLGLMPFGMRLAKTWLVDQRRLPYPREWPRLFRVAMDRYRGKQSIGALSPPDGFKLPEKLDPYQAWQGFNQFNQTAREALSERLANASSSLPRLSIVMPVYNPPLKWFMAAVNSVRDQVYDNWELCIADDASDLPDIRQYLRKLADEDPRIKLELRDNNGNISQATNSAADLATGEFIVLLDQDDLLTPDALAEIALCVAENPRADIIYSDDDKIDSAGHRSAPQFKPDWSPELLLSYMYISHVFAVRRSLYSRVGGMRVGFEGSQDYDFALRASELAHRIVHIPQVLYHWRILPGSTASSGAAKPGSFEAGRRAVQEALDRRGINGHASQPDWARKARVGIFNIEFPDDGPKVSIIIPTRNGLDVLRRCIDSLGMTSYRNYEVIVIDNESDDPHTLKYLESIPHRVERIANPKGRFNFAHLNNLAAQLVEGDLLLFLNNDTQVIQPRWLSQMVGYAGIPGIGAVGARLMYADQRVQHAGIVHGYYNGLAGPAFKLAPDWDNGYLSFARVTRNYLAVTAACLLTPRFTFNALGGFDAEHFEVAYNDVDYCYRLAAQGLRSVYCADACLVHHEGHSRGFLDRPQEVASFRRKYASLYDPYYSPHLSLDDERFAIQPRHYLPDGQSPVRALLCAFNLNLEGAPNSQFELTVGLRERGFVDPIVYAPEDGPLRNRYEAAGIPVHVFEHPLRGVFDERAYDFALDKFGGFISELDVDLVYGNTLQTFYAIDAANRLGLPTLWNPRESEPWQTYFNFLPAPLAARALQCFSYPYRVVFVADATRQVWSPLDCRGTFCVIHNGLDTNRIQEQAKLYPREQIRSELGIADNELMLLLPGTVCERKGQHDLLNALERITPPASQRVHCYIVGDRTSHYSKQMHRLADKLPAMLRGRVHIVPETPEIARYYQAADIFVCTSRVESFPRVILEAMAYGLPIVTSRVFGIAEQVVENVNALFYEPGQVDRLAGHLQRVMSDEVLRRRLASNSKHVLATLNDYSQMVSAYGRLFQEAAGTSAGSRARNGILAADSVAIT